MKQMKRLLVIALAAVMLLSLMIPASALATGPDATTPRTLSIYKYQLSGSEGEAYEPAPGVTFEIFRYAAFTPQIHETMSAESAQSWAAAHPKALMQTVTTDASGCGKWAASSEGTEMDAVYLVMEKTDGTAGLNGQSDPFLISVPYYDDDENGWTYDVEVRLKNRMVTGPTIEKDVESVGNDHAGANLGENQTWIIRTSVPEDLYYTKQIRGDVSGVYAKSYVIRDDLDSRLDYKGNLKVAVICADAEAAVLSESDYTQSGTAESGKPGGTIVLALTENGMRHVIETAGSQNAMLQVTFETSINSSAAAGESIPNSATVEYTNACGYSYEPATVPEDHIPEVHTGGFQIEKVDRDDTSKKLGGAEFHLAASESDARNQVWLKGSDGKEIVLVTDTSGKASYTGLSYDSGATSSQGGSYYYLVETKAPTGYRLDSTPARITVNAGTLRDSSAVYQIPNSLEGEKKPQMPLTGNGAKVGLWAIGMGFIILSGTLGYLGLRSRSKS